ncbi:MFS transporter [Paenibacillus rhizoplanae]
MGMIGLAVNFAPAIGPVLNGWLVENHSWRLLFYILAPCSLLLTLLGVLLVKNVTPQVKKQSRCFIHDVVLARLRRRAVWLQRLREQRMGEHRGAYLPRSRLHCARPLRLAAIDDGESAAGAAGVHQSLFLPWLL